MPGIGMRIPGSLRLESRDPRIRYHSNPDETFARRFPGVSEDMHHFGGFLKLHIGSGH